MEEYVNSQVLIMRETIETIRLDAKKQGIKPRELLYKKEILKKCIVEISKHSVVKIQMNDEYQKDGIYHPVVDRLVKIKFANTYGYIPETREEDGDCIDAYVLIPEYMDSTIFNHPGLQIDVIPLLTLIASDNGEVDNKVITIPYAVFDYFLFGTTNEYDFLAQIFSITIQFYRYKENCFIDDLMSFEDTLYYIKQNHIAFKAEE